MCPNFLDFMVKRREVGGQNSLDFERFCSQPKESANLMNLMKFYDGFLEFMISMLEGKFRSKESNLWSTPCFGKHA